MVPEIIHSRRTAIIWVSAVATLTSFTILVFMSFCGVESPPHQPSDMQRAKLTARMEVTVSVEASFRYRAKFGKLPTGEHQLSDAIMLLEPSRAAIKGWIDTKSGNVIDPWGTPLVILVSTDSFSIVSAGPDRKFGTGDDIIRSNNLLR